MAETIIEPITPQGRETIVEPVESADLRAENRMRKALGMDLALGDHVRGLNALTSMSNMEGTLSSTDLFGQVRGVTEQRRMKSIIDNSTGKSREEQIEESTNLSSNMRDENGQAEEFINTLPTSDRMDDKEKIEEAMYVRYARQLSKWNDTLDQESSMSAFGTFMGTMIPKRATIDSDEFLSELGLSQGFVDSFDTILNDTDQKRQFRNFFQSLKPEQQFIMFNKGVDIIERVSDNAQLKSMMLQDFFGPVFEGEGSSTLFNVADNLIAIDAFDIGKWMMRSGQQIVKMSNKLNRAKDHEGLASLIDDSIDNPKEYAKINHLPGDNINEQDLLLGREARALAVGAPNSLASEIKWMFDEQALWAKDILNNTVRDGIQTAAERKATRKRATQRLQDEDYVKSDSVKIKPVDDHTFKVEFERLTYNAAGKETTVPVKETGFYTTEGIDTMKGVDDMYNDGFWLLDPAARMDKELLEHFVTKIERASNLQAKVKTDLEGIVRLAFKGLDGDNAKNLDRVLRQGRDDDMVFDFETLTKVGVGPENFKLSDKEAVAYLGVRNAIDKALFFQNRIVTENMSARNVRLYMKDDQTVPSKFYEDPETALNSFYADGASNAQLPAGKKGSPHIMIMGKHLRGYGGALDAKGKRNGKPGVVGGVYEMKHWDDIDPDFLNKAYERGYVLVKNDQSSNFYRKGKGDSEIHTQWAMVKRNELIDPRGQMVLNRRVGYMPIARQDGHFFIRTSKAGVLSGSKNFKTQTTVAWSDTEQKAIEWIKKQEGDTEYTITFDRDMESNQLMYESNHVSGGLYTGARRTTPPEFVGNAGKGKFQGTFEALQGMINHVGGQYPINMVRMGIEDRALKIGRHLLSKGGGELTQKDIPTISRLSVLAAEKGVDSKTKKIIDDLVNQVNFLNNVPTNTEVAFSKKLMKWGQAWERTFPKMKTVPRVLYGMSGRGVQGSDLLRSVTFTHMLGMYNPAQLLVQASGFMVSFAINPVYFVKSAPRAFAFGVMDLIPNNPSAQKKAFASLKEMKVFPDQFVEDYQLYRKSGLLENVVNSNADYTSVFTKNLPYDAGLLRRAFQNHTMFYKTGEMVNTRHAFSTALSWYRDTHNVTKIPNGKKAMNEILERTEIYRLNMSRANTSDLNRGWASVPLQFQQVVSKYFEKLLPSGGLTGVERMRLGLIPSVAMGSAGLPMVEEAYVALAELTGVDLQDLSIDEAELFKYGVLGWMLHEGLNVNVDMTNRMQLGTDFPQKVWELLTQPSATWKFMAGPTSAVGQRYAQQIQFMAKSLDLYTDIEETTTMKEDFLVGLTVLRDVALEIPTIGRNWKAYSAYLTIDNPAFYKNGQYIMDFDDINQRTAFFGIMGFQLSETSEAYDLARQVRFAQNGTQGAPTFLKNEPQMIARLLSLGLSSDNPRTIQGIQLITAAMFKNKTPQEAAKLNQQVQDIMFNKKLDQNKSFNDMMNIIITTTEEGLRTVNTTFARKLEETQ